MTSWAIALGVENASGFQDVLTSALEAALVAALLEPYVVPSVAWIEQHADFLSVYGSLAQDQLGSRAQRLLASVRHYSAHIEG